METEKNNEKIKTSADCANNREDEKKFERKMKNKEVACAVTLVIYKDMSAEFLEKTEFENEVYDISEHSYPVSKTVLFSTLPIHWKSGLDKSDR